MGFSSMDDFINKVSVNGQFLRKDFNKNYSSVTAAIAGEWHVLNRGGGNPGADSLYDTGSNLVVQQVSDSLTSAGGIYHGGNVNPSYKHVVNASMYSAAATTVPAVGMLVDLLAFSRVTSVTVTGAQAITHSYSAFSTFTSASGTDLLTITSCCLMPYTRVQFTTTGTLPTGLSLATDYWMIKVSDFTWRVATSYANAVAGTYVDLTSDGSGVHTLNTLLPRYTNGAGVQAFIWNATTSTALGAATPNISLTSTNPASLTGRVTPTVLPVGKTAARSGIILYTGTGAGKYGPFMPLPGGDSGILQLNNVGLSTSYVSGEFSVGLCYPLLTMPMTTIGVACERDFMNQLPSLPRIYDGANLIWLIYAGAAIPTNSAFYGHLDLAWG